MFSSLTQRIAPRSRSKGERGQVSAKSEALERYRLGPIENPIRGALHGSASLAALGITLWLLSREDRMTGDGPFLVFAAANAVLYGVSALYHSLPWSEETKAFMQRLDHATIYLASASIVTAFASYGLPAWAHMLVVALCWTVSSFGAVHKLIADCGDHKGSAPLQIGVVALALPAFPGFMERFPGEPTLLLLLSALAFVIGAICYVTERPRLWPRVFSHHEVFHVCTVIGSAAMCALFYRYLLQVG